MNKLEEMNNMEFILYYNKCVIDTYNDHKNCNAFVEACNELFRRLPIYKNCSTK